MTANSTLAPKRRAPTPGSWKPGIPSPNPAGRPREGESWAATIRDMSSMTAQQIADLVGADSDLGRMYTQLPRGVPLKRLVTARVLAAIMFDPTPGLWAGLMERAEGRIPLAVDFTALALSPEQIEQRIAGILDRARSRLLSDNAIDATVTDSADDSGRLTEGD